MYHLVPSAMLFLRLWLGAAEVCAGGTSHLKREECASLKNVHDNSEVCFSEVLKTPCLAFHGTDCVFESAQMEDRGAGFWFTRNRTDAEGYAERKAARTQGIPRVIEAWVRMEKVLDLGNLYDEATDEVLSELARDAHVRLEVLLKFREVLTSKEGEEPYLFEITNTLEFTSLVKGRFEGMCGVEIGDDGHEYDVCCVFKKQNIYFAPQDGTPVRRVDVGIVDADLLDHGTRHPNLALMKLSGWYNKVKRDGDHVLYPSAEERKARLVTEDDIVACKTLAELVGPTAKSRFGKLVISKVFDFSKLPPILQDVFESGKMTEGTSDLIVYKNKNPRIVYGGTGFVTRLERLPNDLPEEIEHHFPDYHLYDEFVKREYVFLGKKRQHYKDYQDYSIGFLTRGCFRRCSFCVNKHHKYVRPHAHLEEFFDPDRKYIYLWDDNFLALIDHAEPTQEGVKNGNLTWQSLLGELKKTGRAFQFRQGMDIRLVTPELARELADCHYHGDYIFAFDHYHQKASVVKGLLAWRHANPNSITKLYVLCGFKCKGRELEDIDELFKRIRILMHFGTLPYVMRHADYYESPLSGIYIQFARWCNQPQFFKKKSFFQFIIANENVYRSQYRHKEKNHSAPFRALRDFLCFSGMTKDGKNPRMIAREYFNLRWDECHLKWREGDFGEKDLNVELSRLERK